MAAVYENTRAPHDAAKIPSVIISLITFSPHTRHRTVASRAVPPMDTNAPSDIRISTHDRPRASHPFRPSPTPTPVDDPVQTRPLFPPHVLIALARTCPRRNVSSPSVTATSALAGRASPLVAIRWPRALATRVVAVGATARAVCVIIITIGVCARCGGVRRRGVTRATDRIGRAIGRTIDRPRARKDLDDSILNGSVVLVHSMGCVWSGARCVLTIFLSYLCTVCVCV